MGLFRRGERAPRKRRRLRKLVLFGTLGAGLAALRQRKLAENERNHPS